MRAKMHKVLLLVRTLYKNLKPKVGKRAIKRMYGGKHAFFSFLPKSRLYPS